MMMTMMMLRRRPRKQLSRALERRDCGRSVDVVETLKSEMMTRNRLIVRSATKISSRDAEDAAVTTVFDAAAAAAAAAAVVAGSATAAFVIDRAEAPLDQRPELRTMAKEAPRFRGPDAIVSPFVGVEGVVVVVAAADDDADDAAPAAVGDAERS